MLPPGCDQIGYSSTPVRRNCFRVPLHVVKVSYRAPRFVLDLTWSILRQQFVTLVSTLMPIYPDAHTYTENNGVVFCCSVIAADSTLVPAVVRLQITDRVTGA